MSGHLSIRTGEELYRENGIAPIKVDRTSLGHYEHRESGSDIRDWRASDGQINVPGFSDKFRVVRV